MDWKQSPLFHDALTLYIFLSERGLMDFHMFLILGYRFDYQLSSFYPLLLFAFLMYSCGLYQALSYHICLILVHEEGQVEYNPYQEFSKLSPSYLTIHVHRKPFSARLIIIENCLQHIFRAWRHNGTFCEIKLLAIAQWCSCSSKTWIFLINVVTAHIINIIY